MTENEIKVGKAVGTMLGLTLVIAALGVLVGFFGFVVKNSYLIFEQLLNLTR